MHTHAHFGKTAVSPHSQFARILRHNKKAAPADARSHVNWALVVVLVQIQARRKRNAAAVVEEAAEGELEEGVQRLIHVAELVVGGRSAQFVRVDGIEVRRVHRVLDFRYVRRLDAAHAILEVDSREERMLFYFVRVLAEPAVGARAQLQYQIGNLRRDFRVRRYLQVALPCDHLRNISKNTIKLGSYYTWLTRKGYIEC